MYTIILCIYIALLHLDLHNNPERWAEQALLYACYKNSSQKQKQVRRGVSACKCNNMKPMSLENKIGNE